MRAPVLFLAVISAAFASPSWAQEQESLSMSKTQWYLMEAIEQVEPHVQNVFKAGQTYLILGSNNKFLSSVDYGVGNNYIQAIKTQQDPFCRFAASVLESGKVALRGSDGQGHYLQLNNSNGQNNIRPTTYVIDSSAQFEVEVSSPGPWNGAQFVYLKAENGKYWGIVSGTGRSDDIAAAFDKQEEATRLIVLEAC